MSRFIKRSGLAGVVLCLFLTGCGEELWTMTPEEESLIVAYASGAVAKHNKYMVQGLTEYEEPEPEVEEPVQTVPADPEEAGSPEEPGEAENPSGTSGEGEAPEQNLPSGGSVTLAEATGITPVTAQYQGYELTGSYMEGSYFALNAAEGNQLLVLSIQLSNPTQEPVECNNLARGIRCSLLVNGEKQADAISTVLLHDFATYLDTLDPGASQDTILIFEVPREVAEGVQTLALEVETDGVVYHVDLQ